MEAPILLSQLLATRAALWSTFHELLFVADSNVNSFRDPHAIESSVDTSHARFYGETRDSA
jgi:hypothetical protein